MVKRADGKRTVISYRGISITKHPPMVLRDEVGQEIAVVPFSFSVNGLPMMAETLEIAYEMIDGALANHLLN
jgi:hypothetical protein